MTLEQAKTKLSDAGQEHLLRYYDELNEEQKENLLRQIEHLDMELPKMVENGVKEAERGVLAPLGAITLDEIDKKRECYENSGIQAIQECKVGAVLLAGGQGTRLGLDGPKGMLNIGVHKELFLFERLVGNLMEVVEKTGAWIPLFIMTSEKNNDDTVSFFKEKNYFGYDPRYVFFLSLIHI